MMACTGVGRMEEARGLLEEMRRAGFRPDVRAYNILLKGHARERGMASLQELFEEIKRAGLSPSGATYNTLVDAYADAGLLLQVRPHWLLPRMCLRALQVWPAGSRRTLGAMSAGAMGILPGNKVGVGCSADVAFKPKMISATSILKMTSAMGLLSMMTTVGGMGRCWYVQARQTLREAEADGLRLDVWAYSSLIKGYVRGGELPLALSVLDEMQAAGVHPNVVSNASLGFSVQNLKPFLARSAPPGLLHLSCACGH